MSGETLLASTDLLLRRGVFALLLLIAALLARDYSRVIGARLGALFALGTAADAVWSAPGLHAQQGWWPAPILAGDRQQRYVLAFRAGAIR
jgi:hypothetical protein